MAFWSYENLDRGFEYYGPELRDKKIEFTQTVFIPGTTQTVTGTTDGHIIVWDISLIMEDYSVPEERRKIKMVNLMNSGAKNDPNSKSKAHSINILKIQGDYLVIGASNGSVRFYDFKYTIVAWFEVKPERYFFLLSYRILELGILQVFHSQEKVATIETISRTRKISPM